MFSRAVWKYIPVRVDAFVHAYVYQHAHAPVYTHFLSHVYTPVHTTFYTDGSMDVCMLTHMPRHTSIHMSLHVFVNMSVYTICSNLKMLQLCGTHAQEDGSTFCAAHCRVRQHCGKMTTVRLH